MLDNLTDSGVETVFLTLHVGPGTFTPLRKRMVHLNRLESERFSISADAWSGIAGAIGEQRRIVSVGTTTCRVLETLSFKKAEFPFRKGSLAGRTDLFIYPPYRFRNVGALLTNFHLPGTSLLALVAAFMGLDLMLSSYAHAVEERYRFYSYGDAMLILGGEQRTVDGE
jgi:S-adenosylmethionine:tRNA ribosyltransferase-isomerase